MSRDSEFGAGLLGEDPAPDATVDSVRREVRRLIDRDRNRTRWLRRVTLICIAIPLLVGSLSILLFLVVRAGQPPLRPAPAAEVGTVDPALIPDTTSIPGAVPAIENLPDRSPTPAPGPWDAALALLLVVCVPVAIAAIPVGLLTGLLWFLSARSANNNEIQARLVELEALLRTRT